MDPGNFIPDLGADWLGGHIADALHVAARSARATDPSDQHDWLCHPPVRHSAMAPAQDVLGRNALHASTLQLSIAPVENHDYRYLAPGLSRGPKNDQRLYHLQFQTG